MTRPVPNINQAYTMIINMECQIRNNAIVGVGDPTALLSNRAPTSIYNRGYKPKNNFEKSSLQCDFCHLKGHTINNCYKLHGYPNDFRGKKVEGGTPDSKAGGGSSATTSAPSAPLFNQDQYNQILQMLNKGALHYECDGDR
ncbi:uncharacterized protein LOC107794407 isoform X1 [Nicotiana tabacum]|uniref:Uncharacterized protein LOC107794407 isoform X1 n=1 Tax=Nicotiana tabacum TaxID=4097 RepID=A0A1S4A6W5_TOBAC